MKLTQKLLLFILVPILIIVAIILSPLLIFGYIINAIREDKYKKRYPEFLKSVDGKKFLLHTNRLKTKEYVQYTLQPLLPEDIIVTTIDDQVFYTKFDRWCFSRMIHSISPTTYPVLLKIVNERVLTLHINAEFYNTFNQNKDITPLVEKIKNF